MHGERMKHKPAWQPFSARPHMRKASLQDNPATEQKRLEVDFWKFADEDSRISLEDLMQTGEIQEMLKDELLAQSEIEEFWDRQTTDSRDSLRLEEYLAVHALIDDLFEDEKDSEGDIEQLKDAQRDAWKSNDDYQSSSPRTDSKRGHSSLPQLLARAEVQVLLESGQVKKEDAEGVWDTVAGPDTQLVDVVRANEILEQLQDLAAAGQGEDDQADEIDDSQAPSDLAVPLSADEAELLQEFRAVAGGDGKVDFAQFLTSGEIPDLLEEGLVEVEELREIFASMAVNGKVGWEGYRDLVQKVDALFDEDAEEVEVGITKGKDQEVREVKEEVLEEGPAFPSLLQLLSDVREGAGWLEENRQLDGSIIRLIQALSAEEDENNLAQQDNMQLGALCRALEGEWDLLYTTSRTMRYNRGLSGLGKSLPKAQFYGLQQTIRTDGYAYESIYTENLKTLGRDLKVVVEGSWELKDVVSIMDGEVCLVLDVIPAEIKWSVFRERLETGWKGVRVLNRCEVIFLDERWRIMKGQSSDSYFIFRRRKK